MLSASRHPADSQQRRYTAGTVQIAVITFEFDPLVALPGDLVVRWQTIALAAVILASLVVVALLAGRRGLRADDLLSIAVGVVPGAIIGGRLGYLLVRPEAFTAGPLALVDPGVPGLELGLGVVGGIISGAYVASLLGAPLGRWAHVLALPLLVAIGAGKLALILGGTGQGLPFDGQWATAFLGPGPWGSLAPALPSHPSQAYEGIGTLVAALVLGIVVWLGAFGRADGRLLAIAVAAWAFVRAATSLTWRDLPGPAGLPVAGWLSLAIGVGALVVAIGATVALRRRPSGQVAGATEDGPSWPDPEARPRF